MVIRLLHSCPALVMRVSQHKCFVHSLGCFGAKTGRKNLFKFFSYSKLRKILLVFIFFPCTWLVT